jgi:hypothetical protein
VIVFRSTSTCFHSCHKALQQPAQTRTQVLFGIFDHPQQVFAKLYRPHREGDAAFQQESPNLVDERRATLHQPISDAVHGLHVELFLSLNLHKPHILLGHRLPMASASRKSFLFDLR